MTTRIVTSALFAGATAGFAAGLLQWQFVQPDLLHSELYEQGTLTHFGGALNSTDVALERLQPMRDALSILFTMLLNIGYALILIALMSVRVQKGDTLTPHKGIIWGVAGYVAVHLAPALSLPPEVPGVAAADVEARQVWWFATVFATMLGLWLISFSQQATRLIAGIVLILLPHLIGAPEPDVFTGPAPTEIGALFAGRALGIGIASWALLGYFSALFFNSETKRAEAQAAGAEG